MPFTLRYMTRAYASPDSLDFFRKCSILQMTMMAELANFEYDMSVWIKLFLAQWNDVANENKMWVVERLGWFWGGGIG